MKRGQEFGAAIHQSWRAALLFLPIAAGPVAAHAAISDFLLDEGQRNPVELKLSSEAERKAEAMARFLTGMFEEESKGPERATESYREVLRLDPGGSVDLAIEVAYDYLRRDKSAEAIGVLKDAIKARPDQPEPALALSSIYLRHLRKPDLATRYAEAALKAAPTKIAGYEALYEIAQAQGDTEGAMNVLDRALKAKNVDTTFWLQLAELLSSATEGDAFLEPKLSAKLNQCLEKAAATATDDAGQLARVADFFVLNHQYEKAVSFYQKAAELRPNLPNLQEKLAGTLLELGRNDEAIPVLEKVIAGNPLNLQAYDNLERLYRQREDYAKALTYAEQGLILDKDNPARHQTVAILLMAQGRYDEVVRRLAETRKRFPGIPMFSYLEAQALSVTAQHEAAMRAFERTLVEASSVQPELLDSMFYFDYGCAAERAGRYVKAADLFKKSIERDPEKAAMAYNALGYMWAERGENLDEAEKLIRKALKIDPGSGAYIDSLGWVLYQRGEYEAALEQLLRAVKALEYPDPVVFEHVGDAYAALDRTAEAMLYWQKALGLDPENKKLLAKVDEMTEKVAKKPETAENP